jgi:hypothetical protein
MPRRSWIISGLSLEEIAYLASLRSLDKQEGLLDELRARTGLLLAVSSLAASFAGRTAIETAPPWLCPLVGAAFALSTASCVFILVPRRYRFYFSIVGSRLFEELFEFRDDIDDVQRRLAYQLDRFWAHNDGAMQALFLAFRIAVVGLAVEILGVPALLGDKLV